MVRDPEEYRRTKVKFVTWCTRGIAESFLDDRVEHGADFLGGISSIQQMTEAGLSGSSAIIARNPHSPGFCIS